MTGKAKEERATLPDAADRHDQRGETEEVEEGGAGVTIHLTR